MEAESIVTSVVVCCIAGGAIAYDNYGGYDKDEAEQFFKSRQLAEKVLSDANTVILCKRSLGSDIYWDKTSNTIYSLSSESLASFEDAQPQAKEDVHNTRLMQNAKNEAEMINTIKHDLGC